MFSSIVNKLKHAIHFSEEEPKRNPNLSKNPKFPVCNNGDSKYFKFICARDGSPSRYNVKRNRSTPSFRTQTRYSFKRKNNCLYTTNSFTNLIKKHEEEELKKKNLVDIPVFKEIEALKTQKRSFQKDVPSREEKQKGLPSRIPKLQNVPSKSTNQKLLFKDKIIVPAKYQSSKSYANRKFVTRPSTATVTTRREAFGKWEVHARCSSSSSASRTSTPIKSSTVTFSTPRDLKKIVLVQKKNISDEKKLPPKETVAKNAEETVKLSKRVKICEPLMITQVETREVSLVKEEVFENCRKEAVDHKIYEPSKVDIDYSCKSILVDTENTQIDKFNHPIISSQYLEELPLNKFESRQVSTVTLYLTQEKSFGVSNSEFKCEVRKSSVQMSKFDGDVQDPNHLGAIPLEDLRKHAGRFEICIPHCNPSDRLMRSPVYLLGETDSGSRSHGEPQNFYDLRDQNLQNGTLFEDPDFPANDSSLYFSRRADRHYEWLRPGEIVDNPQLFVEGYSRFDVLQGELGDCWLLAAVANLTLYRRLFFQIVPDDQGFEEKYAGIFHFRFWQYGKWIDVVIDDRLPTYRGKLIYLSSNEENEFWSALLEKAYAKLNGSYEALKGGSACEAMEDFTGGVTEMYEMNATPPNLFKILIKAFERGSLMSGSLEPDPSELEAHTPEGLIRGHAYSITQVKYVDIRTPNVTGKIPLLRLRNPWGNEDEWNGPWSDRSPEWQYIPQEEKDALGLTFDYDGEFWMSYKDFQTHFSRLEICNLTPDSLTEEELEEGHKKKWEMSVFEGDWVRGVTAGGCRNHLDTFWHNPQYRVTLTDPDDDDEEGKATLIVALMQKHRRSKKFNGVEFLTIGFAVYHLSDPNRVPKPLDLNFFKYNSSVARSPSFINLREVTCRFRLPPGTYCIIPSTFDPNEEGEFLLRVFSESKNIMEEHDEDVALGQLDERVTNRSITTEEQEVDERTHKMFLLLAGEDLEVDWLELQDILDFSMKNETKNKGFSASVCRSMVALLDKDRSGKLGYPEFKKLWIDIRNWKMAFKLYDTDNSSTLSGFELRQALNSAGYRINNRILNALVHRFGNKQSELIFEEFILCALKLKAMIELFKSKDHDESDMVKFNLEDWIETTLYT